MYVVSSALIFQNVVSLVIMRLYKDLQKKILEQKTDIEDFYAKIGQNAYITYSINMEMITRWSNEKYTDTIFKKKIYDEIELIEKEPIPEKK